MSQLQEPIYASAWAKSDRFTGDSMPLITHCEDTGAVAELYWEHYLSESCKRTLEEWLSTNEVSNDANQLARKLAVFLASSHDVGKLSPAFSIQVEPLRAKMESAGFLYTNPLSEKERRFYRHSLISQTATSAWLEKKFPSSSAPRIRTIACISGGHHGNFQDKSALREADPGSIGTGSEPIWQQAREALLEDLQVASGLTDDELKMITEVGLSQPCQIILTAFVIICDWIASNADLFSYHSSSTAQERALDAFNKLELPLPWLPMVTSNDEELFINRFELPKGTAPRPVQKEVMRVAREIQRPSLMIVEAPTGEGKTELAFAAAEIFAQRFGSSGVFIGLPTQATSNAMFSRTIKWLQHSVPNEDTASVNLMHGKAQFNDEFSDLKSWNLRAIGENKDDALEAHWWLSGRKKSILADFVVGTIDQVLMASLSSKHVVLRLLGLASKVVILDEVHAADEYMQVYLDSTLKWLGALGVPVIALSATLPPKRRAEMLSAYQQGRHDSKEEIENVKQSAFSVSGYPLISVAEAELAPRVAPPSGRSSSTAIEFLGIEPEELAAKVIEETKAGGCVAVIHNTVGRAQKTFGLLRETLGPEVVLLHSRFIATDRLEREAKLVNLLGPKGSRPRRLVVVATQVIEQSLDLDFDLMISDLAPIDSLIQRIGRLHRHDRLSSDRPERMRSPRLLIPGLEEASEQPPELEKGSAIVYGESLLLRTLSTLHHHLESSKTLTSPSDVPLLVERAYSDDLVAPCGWEDMWAEAESIRRKEMSAAVARAETGLVPKPAIKATSLDGWSKAKKDANENAFAKAVRDISDSIEVIAVVRDSDGVIRTLDWLDKHADEPVDLGVGLDDDFAKHIAQCSLRLPAWLAKGKLGDLVISELEKDGIPCWQSSYWLRGLLPLVLNSDLTKQVGNYLLRYSRDVGLVVEKIEES